MGNIHSYRAPQGRGAERASAATPSPVDAPDMQTTAAPSSKTQKESIPTIRETSPHANRRGYRAGLPQARDTTIETHNSQSADIAPVTTDSLTIRTGNTTVTHPTSRQVFIHPSDRRAQTEPIPDTPTDEPDNATFKRTVVPEDEPPIYRETKVATREPVDSDSSRPTVATPITDQPTARDPKGEETPQTDKPSLDDLFKGLGKDPSARISQEKTLQILSELPPDTKIEIVLGEGVRNFISGMQSGVDLPPLSIYGEKEGSWYVDLLNRTDEGLPPDKQESTPRTIQLVKTPDSTSEGLIEQVDEMNPNSMQRAASEAGGLKHEVARLNWSRYFGPDHTPELPLKSGSIPDVTDLVEHRVAEYGSIPHAMEKVVKTGKYARDAQDEYGGEWTGEVYVYDHNRTAWQALYARKQEEKQ